MTNLIQYYVNEMTEAFSKLNIDSVEREHRRYIEFGDEESRDKLVLSVAPMAMKILQKLDVPKDLHDDCIQAGHLGAFRAVETWRKDRGRSFSTWAWGIIRTSIVREVSKLTQLRGMADTALLDDEEFPVENENGELDNFMVVLQIYNEIENLPPRQRELINHVLDGLHAGEAAEQMGISRQKGYVLYDKAVKNLQKAIVGG